MEHNKKSFIFRDYLESEITYNNNENKLVKVSDSRVDILSFIFLSLMVIFSIKIIYLSLFPEKNLTYKELNHKFKKKRADIVDRNGTILARSIDIYSAGIRPKLVNNKKKLLINLKLLFINKDEKNIKNKLKKNKFFYIKKRLTENEKTKLWLIGNKAIIFEKKQLRIYPQQSLLSHAIGQIDDNNIGISGIEKYFDQDLKKTKLMNSSLELSLDSNLQYLVRNELIEAKKVFNQKGSAALLMLSLIHI